MKTRRHNAAFTLVEVMIASTVTAVVLAGATVGIVALQKGFAGYRNYATGLNDGSRLIDYVSRDLRNAIKVSRRDGEAVLRFPLTKLNPNESMEINTVQQLAITVPDYFLSNVPNNQSGSTYKTPRYDRVNLAGRAYWPYDDVVSVIGALRVPKYPAEVEVRYVRKPASAQDPHVYYLRQEYEGAVLRSERDIAEKVENQKVIVTSTSDRRFQVQASFGSKWSGDTLRKGTRQYSTVQLLNKRRD